MSNIEKKNKLQPIGLDSTRYHKKKISFALPLILGLLLFSFACQKSAQLDTTSNITHASTNNTNGASKSAGSETPAAPQTHLRVGDKAPDFMLTDTTGQQVKLSDFQGKKNVVLAFYVMAFTGG